VQSLSFCSVCLTFSKKKTEKKTDDCDRQESPIQTPNDAEKYTSSIQLRMDRPKWVGEGPLAVALMWNIAVDKEPLRAEPPRLLTQHNNPFPFTKRDSKFVTRRRPSDHEFHAEKPPQIAALLRCMFPETVSEYKANSMSVYTLWEHLSSYFLQFYAKNERRHAKNASLWYLTIETQWGRTAVRQSTRTGRPGWEGFEGHEKRSEFRQSASRS